MQWVTLISDLGLTDPSVGQLKGAMVARWADLQFIDLTHDIKPHDIVTAGWVLKNSYQDAPAGSIHVVSVLNNYHNAHSYLAFEYDGHYFVGPNNGVFSLAFEKLPRYIYEYKTETSPIFSVKKILSHMVSHLAAQKPIQELGNPVRNLILRIQLQPVINKYMIRGSVIYIDRYENVVVNITREQFEKNRAGRDFSVYIKRNDAIREISTHYQDVPVGETLCLFNSNNYLEIAIHAGTAASMLGLSVDETVQIDFFAEKV
ncbi:MAG: SAM-dependent chlorinase/fluorinase [Saprospiraceae bacterium]|nr:SAM-dependent chlorinase/fluorinase [Saprospiraceae bacterium]